MSAILPPTAEFGWPTLNLSAIKIWALTDYLIGQHFGYSLGAKIIPLSIPAPTMGTDENGNPVHGIDCSGLVSWAIYHATNATGDPLTPVDGSANQHQWFIDQGFKPSTYEDALLGDGVLRIGFLAPGDTSEGIGHVLFVRNGSTAESHGDGVGPSHRVLADLEDFAPMMHYFVVCL